MRPYGAISPEKTVLGFSGASVLILLLLPEESPIKCPVYSLFGIYCPGCGGQRAIQELLQGDLIGAVGQNGVVFVAPILISVTLLNRRFITLRVILAAFAARLMVSFVALRNISGSPLATS